MGGLGLDSLINGGISNWDRKHRKIWDHGGTIINSIQDIWASDTIKTSNAKADIDKWQIFLLTQNKNLNHGQTFMKFLLYAKY